MSFSSQVKAAPAGAVVVLHDLDALEEVAAMPHDFALALVGDVSRDRIRLLGRAVTIYPREDLLPEDAIHLRRTRRRAHGDAG